MMSGSLLDDIPMCERIFCNRSLNINSIQAVGFDMDYTLALYRPDTFEKLAYDETIKKLIAMGYPKDMSTWRFDPTYMIRGLAIDKKRGNILKMDRHRYVKLAYRGFRELSRDERRQLYDIEKVPVYEEPDFAMIDTIFSLAEAYLFAQLVDYKEKTNKFGEKSFIECYYDIRNAIDLCHRDGSIKNKVAQDPQNYIEEDPYLLPVLEELLYSGRKIFIATNSLWNYTDVVMGFLLKNRSKEIKKWNDLFHVVITGSYKPRFFDAKNLLYQVDLPTGLLRNIEQIPKIGKNGFSQGNVFQGGHVKILHEMLAVSKGSEILYVGDHIYGDILRSKKEIGWRTMLVIPELTNEIVNLEQSRKQHSVCALATTKRFRVEEELGRIQAALVAKTSGRRVLSPQLESQPLERLENRLQGVRIDLAEATEQEKKAMRLYQQGFHPVWGELMKTNNQNSRFADQVENYACLYTSTLTNLRHYSAKQTFAAAYDTMPHDEICI